MSNICKTCGEPMDAMQSGWWCHRCQYAIFVNKGHDLEMDAREEGELPLVLAVDFDGTLCENAHPDIGAPIEANIRAVQAFSRAGWAIILWTCREGKLLYDAKVWCDEHEIPIDFVNENHPAWIDRYGNDCRKIGATVYLDDRAVAMLPSEPGAEWDLLADFGGVEV